MKYGKTVYLRCLLIVSVLMFVALFIWMPIWVEKQQYGDIIGGSIFGTINFFLLMVLLFVPLDE